MGDSDGTRSQGEASSGAASNHLPQQPVAIISGPQLETLLQSLNTMASTMTPGGGGALPMLGSTLC